MKLTAAVISLGSVSSKWIAEALKKHFEHVEELDLKEIEVSIGKKSEVLYKGKPLEHYDCIYARGSYRYANVLRALTTLLKETTYFPLTPEAFTIGHDKILTHLALQPAQTPQPKTYVVATAEAAKKILKKISYPVVIKLPSGTHGKGVMLADSQESASSMIDALAVLKQPFLLQEYIETGGTDTRAIVIGNKVAASMKRIAVRGEKRANMHAGGMGKIVKLDERTQQIAIKAARACGCDVCAVDLLQGPLGPLVIEINLSPGLQGITKVTGINVSEILAEELYTRTIEFKKGGQEKAKKTIMKELFPGQEIVGNIVLRGERILLPSEVTKIGQFNTEDQIIIRVEKNKIIIERFE